jgi:hypothetical protein
MKKHALLLLLVGLGSLMIAAQLRADSQTHTVRRVRLQATGAISAQLHLIVAAEGTEGVGGTGTDLNELAEGAYCALQYNSVSFDEDGDTVVLIGKATEASDPFNDGAFVKVTAHTDGRVNFVFQALTKNGAQTGAAGLNFTGGTVTIEKVLP